MYMGINYFEAAAAVNINQCYIDARANTANRDISRHYEPRLVQQRSAKPTIAIDAYADNCLRAPDVDLGRGAPFALRQVHSVQNWLWPIYLACQSKS
jgi:hypothetical protein